MSSNFDQRSWLWRWFWSHLELAPHLQNTEPEAVPTETQNILKTNHFDWRFTVVASLGFLASSYSLFATGIIWPALAYVYPRDRYINDDNDQSTSNRINSGVAFDLVTLGGIIVGMVVFGHLADRVGRKKLYGLELIIIAIATIGIAFSSDGFMVPTTSQNLNENASQRYMYNSTMNIFNAVTTWRALLGVGIGAEYPMSAIIASECLSTEWRGTIIAIVFAMQSLARLLAFGFAKAFLEGQLNVYSQNNAMGDSPREYTGYIMSLIIDKTWRFVAGFGGIFALVAIGLRLTMPESPRYMPGIGDQLQRAMDPQSGRAVSIADENRRRSHAEGNLQQQQPTQTETQTQWLVGARRYLNRDDNMRRFTLVCVLWFLLDICFYGTGLDSPKDPANPQQSIYWVLDNNSARVLEVSSISAMAGSLLMVPLINYFTRKNLLFFTSLILSILFFITGALVATEYAQSDSRASLVFFALAQFTFNIGPNTILFVLVAEIFPTVFRGTFYGLTAACGKVGAMIIRPCVQIVAENISSYRSGNPLATMLFVFGAIMLVIALITRFLSASLPDVQKSRAETGSKWYERMENKHLENIAQNPGPGELAPKVKKSYDQNNGAQDDSERVWQYPDVHLYEVDHQSGQRVRSNNVRQGSRQHDHQDWRAN